jgi:hypothetical protein
MGTLALATALAWVTTTLEATNSGRTRAAQARVSSSARVMARALETFDPEAGLESLKSSGRVASLARSVTQDLAPGSTVRIAEPDPVLANLITKTPHQPQTGAFRVIGSSVEKDPVVTVDYLPELDPVMTEGRTVVLLQGSQAVAYTPVRDEWNHPLAMIRVAESYQPSAWARLGDLLLRLVAALGCAALVTYATDVALRRHAANLLDLAYGYGNTVIERPMLSTEVLALASRTGGPLPARAPNPETVAADTLPAARQARAPGPAKRAVFEPRKLLERCVQALRPAAARKGVEISIVCGADVPRRLIGSPRAISAALQQLLQNAVSHTRQGSIQVRAQRVLERLEYRFEVVDTGVGIPWQFQPALDEVMRRAAGRDPREFPSGLERVSAIAARLGGELGFESQPGAGSRFFLSARCEPCEAVAQAQPAA